MTLTAKTASPLEWKAVSAAIKLYLEEATFTATPQGLGMRGMDPSHIALVDVTWPSAAFEKFECDKDSKFTVRMEDFVKLFGRSDAKDSVELIDSEEALSLKFEGSYKRKFDLHKIESSGSDAPLPKLDLDAKLVFSRTIFEKVLNDVGVVADQVSISTSKEGVIEFAGKSDVGTALITLDKGSIDVLSAEVKEAAKASYNIDYLLSQSKAIGSAADVVTLEYSAKKPACLTFKLNEQGTTIQFFLAPRIMES
jgi:proliferating cell nuclear antigen